MSAVVLMLLAAGCGGSGSEVSAEQSVIDVPQDEAGIELTAAPIDQATPFSNLFDDTRLTEVSGVQRSGLSDSVYYVHNDSISGVQATDWEAIAGARLNGVAHIVIADIGNNDLQRNDLRLQVVEEPDLNALNPGFEIEVSSREVGVSYADGSSHDAEALFIDGDNDTVVVVTKNTQNTTEQSIWRGSLSTGLIESNLVLEFVGVIPLPDQAVVNAVTDIDIHPDGRQLAVLTYD